MGSRSLQCMPLFTSQRKESANPRLEGVQSAPRSSSRWDSKESPTNQIHVSVSGIKYMSDKILRRVCNSTHREISSDLGFLIASGVSKSRTLGRLPRGCECVGPLFSLALLVGNLDLGSDSESCKTSVTSSWVFRLFWPSECGTYLADFLLPLMRV